MNITPQVPNLSIPTVLNMHTESLRRENNQREIITQPAATSKPASEKGVASDRERSKTPAQNNANIDFASISEQAELANTSISGQDEQQKDQEGNEANNPETSAQESKESKSVDGEEKTRAEELEYNRIVGDLKKRDQEVRTHESAHASVGGAHTGTPSFTYEQGPDGKRYAVEGEVSVDLSTIKGDPRATIAKMQKVHAAALAPVHPSIQDTRIANTATQLILQAQSELLTELGNKQDEAKAKSILQQGEDADESGNLNSDNQNTSSSFEVLVDKTLKKQDDLIQSEWTLC